MVDILPTLPPRAQVSFLRADGSVFKSMEMNPNDRDLNEVLRVVGGPGVLACVIPAEARQLVPASTGYIAWYEMRGRWEPCFGMTPAEAMEQAMAWGELGDPPGYGTAQTDSM